MKFASARSSRAPASQYTANRAPEIFAACSKFRMPSCSPNSQCGFGAKSNARGVPHRRTSTLSSAVVPGGTLSAGRLGICCSTACICCSAAAASAVQRSISSFMDRVRSINSAASSPFCFRLATSAEIWFRSAFKLSDCVIAARRVRSNSSKPSSMAATSAPRRPSLSFTCARFARTYPKSSISIHFTGLSGEEKLCHPDRSGGTCGFCAPAKVAQLSTLNSI